MIVGAQTKYQQCKKMDIIVGNLFKTLMFIYCEDK